jgi:hypothetical protein
MEPLCEQFLKTILKFQEIARKILEVENNVSYQCEKFQLKIPCILGCISKEKICYIK